MCTPTFSRQDPGKKNKVFKENSTKMLLKTEKMLINKYKINTILI